jgi:hypothetical protein
MTTRYVDPAASGSNDGTNWTNAWTSIQSAFDTAVAGDIVYCRGTETRSATIDVDTQTGDTTNGFIKFIGCNASGNVDGTRFVIQGDGANSCALLTKAGAQNLIWLENVEVKSAVTNYGVTTGNTYGYGWVFINCSFNNNASTAFYNGRYFNGAVFFRCTFYSNGGRGFDQQTVGQALFLFCSFHDNTGYGLYSTCPAVDLIGCVFHGNGDHGLFISSVSSPSRFFNCVFDGDGNDGLYVDSATYPKCHTPL